MKRLVTVVSLALVGCASSGPIPIGKDTFMITKQSAGGAFVAASSIKAELMKEAYEHCGSQGRMLQVVNTNETPSFPGRMPSAEVQFMCLEDGDRELARPKLRRTPDVIVETRK